jgi:hypothetical protein
MRLNGANNRVGIGTDAPATNLHVHTTSSHSEIRVSSSASGGGTVPAVSLNNTAVEWGMGILGDNHLHFRENTASYASRLTIADGGNVGIGNTSPPSKLTVNGTIALYDSSADPDLTVTESGNVSKMGAGEINIVQGWSGTLSAGDTLIFTYNKVSWAAYGFEIEGTNAGRWGKIEGGGYSNGGPGLQSHTNVGNLFSSFAITSTPGNNQGLVMTMTLSGGVHTVFRIRYFQGGGDSVPLASRATLDLNS